MKVDKCNTACDVPHNDPNVFQPGFPIDHGLKIWTPETFGIGFQVEITQFHVEEIVWRIT
jgi:hypothetical protein